MPVVDLHLVGPAAGLPPDLSQRVADAAAACLGAAPGHVWVRVHVIAASHYAENGGPLADDQRPAFVTLLHAHPPEGAARADEATRLTAAIAACLGRPAERVHLEYAPAGAGRIAFGGRLVD